MVTLAPVAKARRPRSRVEILGVFGSGKTTLAQRLSTSCGLHLAEDHRMNPFWGRKEAIETAGDLAYDLSFLLQHCHLAAEPGGREPVDLGICDWSFASDRLWASMRLQEGLDAYDAVFSRLNQRLGPPLGYLYLRQPETEIVSRLKKRGRRLERQLLMQVGMAVAGLENLVAALPKGSVLECDDSLAEMVFSARVIEWRQDEYG